MRAVVAAVLAGMVLSACSLAPGIDKSGGDGPPLTLTFATSDRAGASMGTAYRRFAADVARATDGRVRIVVDYGQGAGAKKFDQVVAGQVQSGTDDLGMVPARSWDDLGVSSLRPLQTPFLVDSDDLVDAIITGDLAAPLMSGLDEARVHGLALWPESLRHPIGFEHPLLSVEDFHGARLRAPYSRDVYALLRALGSEPVDVDGVATNAALAAGRLDGAETGADQAVPVGAATMTYDITFYAKIDTIVVNDSVWDQLAEGDRSALTVAARETRDWMVAERPRDDDALLDACERGLGVAKAGTAAVAAIQLAARPVVQRLRADPALAPMIQEIEALKAEVVPDPYEPQECAVSDDQADIGPVIDPAVLDGTYRTSFTEEELLAGGQDPRFVEGDSGLWTFTLDGGHYTGLGDPCTATYEVSATMIAFQWDVQGGCSGDWTAHWERTRSGLRFLDVQSTYAGDRYIWGAHEWLALDQ